MNNSKLSFTKFIEPLIISSLLLFSQHLFSQIHITIVDEENSPIQFVQIFNKNTGALISTSSYDGSINIKDTDNLTISTISLFHPNFIEKTLIVNNLSQNTPIVLERKYKTIEGIEITANNPKNKAIVIEAYVRNYYIENDSLAGYLDAIVEYVMPFGYKKDKAQPFLKEYRVFAQANIPKKKRKWIEVSFSNAVGIPNMRIKSILVMQKDVIQITDNVIYLKKHNDSIVGDINLKNGILKVQIDKAIGDKAVHNFLGYRIKYLHDIKTENYYYTSSNTFLEIPEIKNVITKNSYQKVLIKHKKDANFNIIEDFSDIIILKYNYIKLDKVKTMKKQKFSSDKSIYQDSFWINHMESLPSPINEQLKKLVEL